MCMCTCVRVNCVKLGPRELVGHSHWVYDKPLWFPTQDTDLVPSDIAAGLALLHQQQDSIRNNQEPDEVVSHSPGPSQVSPRLR